MEKYKNLKKISEGAFGIVYQATNEEDGEYVAIKEMKKKYTNWDECKNLREVKSLINLKHTNIIRLKEIIRVTDTLYLVFEYMERNLYDIIRYLKTNNKSLNESQIRYIMYNLIQGVSFMHRHGFFHRDLKPENILIKENEIKIADFGLAREIRSIPPYTDYVSTRWYRAPECLFKVTNYNSPVDMWALGAIMIELLNLEPAFPGSSERDTLMKISNLVGSPYSDNYENYWDKALGLSYKFGLKFQSEGCLRESLQKASDEAYEVIKEMLKWDPNKRATPNKILAMKFFSKDSFECFPQLNTIFDNEKKNVINPIKDQYKTIDDSDEIFNKMIDDLTNNKQTKKNIEVNPKDSTDSYLNGKSLLKNLIILDSQKSSKKNNYNENENRNNYNQGNYNEFNINLASYDSSSNSMQSLHKNSLSKERKLDDSDYLNEIINFEGKKEFKKVKHYPPKYQKISNINNNSISSLNDSQFDIPKKSRNDSKIFMNYNVMSQELSNNSQKKYSGNRSLEEIFESSINSRINNNQHKIPININQKRNNNSSDVSNLNNLTIENHIQTNKKDFKNNNEIEKKEIHKIYSKQRPLSIKSQNSRIEEIKNDSQKNHEFESRRKKRKENNEDNRIYKPKNELDSLLYT